MASKRVGNEASQATEGTVTKIQKNKKKGCKNCPELFKILKASNTKFFKQFEGVKKYLASANKNQEIYNGQIALSQNVIQRLKTPVTPLHVFPIITDELSACMDISKQITETPLPRNRDKLADCEDCSICNDMSVCVQMNTSLSWMLTNKSKLWNQQAREDLLKMNQLKNAVESMQI